MATPKRKRTTTRTKPNKRSKYVEQASDAERSSSEPLWDAERILDERGKGRKLQYLIEWKGVDPATGEPYAPSWEPKESPTPDLIREWQEKKAEQARAGPSKAAKASKTDTRPAKQQQQDRPAARRPSLAIESSPAPEPSTADSTTASATPQANTIVRDDTAPAIPPSSTGTSPIASPHSPSKRPSPAIHVEPRSSFDPNDYERFTQLPPTQGPSPPPDTQASDLDSSQLFAAAPVYHSSGIVPDSQSSIGEGSFAPDTQHTTDTTQFSSTAEDLEEDEAEDSGLLEIVQQTTSRAPSPARSIPETVYDTTVESQTQRQRSVSEERPEEGLANSLEAADESLTLIEENVRLEHDAIDSTPLSVAQEHSERSNSAVDPSVQAALTHLLGNEPQQPLEVSSSHDFTSSSAFVGAEEAQNYQGVDESQRDLQKAQEPDRQQDGGYPSDRAVAALSNPEAPASQHSGASISEVIEFHNGETHEQEHAANLEGADGAAVSSLNEDEESLSNLVEHQTTATQVQGERGDRRHLQSGDNTQGPERQDLLEASLAGRSELDDTAQHYAPYRQPPLDGLKSIDAQESACEILREEEPGLISSAQVDASGASEQLDSTHISTSTSEAAQAPSDNNPPAVFQPVQGGLNSPDRIEHHISHIEYPGLKPPRISTPEVAQQTQGITHPITATQSTTESTQAQVITVETNFSLEQNAQVVHSDHDIPTQVGTTETIWPTIEKAYIAAPSSQSSRHDSSQDTPEPPARPVTQSSSPIAPPPNDSLATLVSNVPSRPRTPVPTSSLSIMATPPDIAAAWKQNESDRNPDRLKKRAEMQAAKLRESLGATDASISPVPSETLADASNVQPNLLQTGFAPSAPLTEGTRSPSTVPDRVPGPQAPTSLRTIALTQAGKAPSGEMREEEGHTPSANAPTETAAQATPALPAIITTEATMADVTSSDDDDPNEASDQSQATEQSQATDRSEDSLLEEELDLNLAVNEKMVPLSMQVRQRHEYLEMLKKEEKMLMEFLSNMHSYEPLANIQGFLSKLRDLENHFDLIYEEADLPPKDEPDDDTQQSNALTWGIDNAAKFRFLWGMFKAMRHQNKHILLVTQNDSDALYRKIEQLSRSGSINFKMPTKDRQATKIEGDLLVTIFPSTLSPILKPADLIICLDGVQDANQIRRKNWAVNPSMDFVPVLHLVIPRSVGHIERCLSSSLGDRKNMHTILASLAQMRHQLGETMNGDVIDAAEAAAQVAAWLDNKDSDAEEWPLEPLGSVREVVEFLTQRSRGSATPPAVERSKRPHEEEVLDPAKRMRLTPQPQDGVSSSLNDNEVTRISDSMPGTAVDSVSTLRSQMAYVESILKKERSERQAEQAHFQETKIMWERQQTEYEDLARNHRLLQSSLKELNEKNDMLTRSNDSFRERLATRTEEARTAVAQLKEERETHLLSNDEKTVEIAKLRSELAQAIQDKDRAVKSATSADSTLEYMKEQYRTAQDAATSSAAAVANLEAQNAKLAHAASGERQKLKSMHLDRQHKTQAAANKSLRAENGILKKALTNKEDELARAKLNGGRMGVGTRATSVTPQPNRVRSRAGSPSIAGGRLSNLRNG